MITIIAGGKKNSSWVAEACAEYEKRLRKPFVVSWKFFDEDKLEKYLTKWPFSSQDFIILLDERGENISSPEFSKKLTEIFNRGRNITIIIGGAYGVTEEVRTRANFILSFSKLVFPHALARIMIIEQIYRAQEITRGGKYHHI